jgi:hypothetical protein
LANKIGKNAHIERTGTKDKLGHNEAAIEHARSMRSKGKGFLHKWWDKKAAINYATES